MMKKQSISLSRRGMIAGLASCLSGAAHGASPIPRIVMFGDSLTAGYGLPEADGMVPVLAHWLSRQNVSARLVKAGLSGDTTYGGRVRINWSLKGGADAVIVELGGNDMLLGWSSARAEANFDAILQVATAAGRPVLLVGIHAPGGSDAWRKGWAEMWPRLANRHGTLLLQDLYAPIAQASRVQQKALLQSDGIHPSAQGVRLIVDHLGPQVKKLVQATN